jgi:HK97 family phage portal protein
MPINVAMVQRRSDVFHVSQDPPGRVVHHYGQETYTGEPVTVEGSLSVTAVMAGFTILSEDTASLPLILYRRLKRGKERATDNPYYALMHDAPNPEHTSMVFRELLAGHLVGWGNFYGQLMWDNKGIVQEIWPLRPDRMEVFRENGVRKYIYQPITGLERAFRQDEILHIPAFGFDGLTGLSRIAQARNAISLSIAAEKFGAKFFTNDARPGIVLKHPGALGDEAYKHLSESWGAIHQGVDNSHKPAILEEGMSLETIGIPPEDAQFLQTRQFQVAEVARIFRIPPHMIGDVQKSTSWGSGIEQQELGYLSHTLRPWLTRIEQQLNKDLLLSAEKRDFVFEHLTDVLLRTDTTSRFQAYAQAITNGFMTRNEAREKENWNPIDGLDEPLVPLNMQEAGATPDPKIAPRTMDIKPLLRDVAERIARREVNELRDAVKRCKDKPEKYATWLEGFYKREHPAFIAQLLRPFVEAFYFTEDRAQGIIDAYCDQRGDLLLANPLEDPTTDHFLQVIEEKT